MTQICHQYSLHSILVPATSEMGVVTVVNYNVYFMRRSQNSLTETNLYVGRGDEQNW